MKTSFVIPLLLIGSLLSRAADPSAAATNATVAFQFAGPFTSAPGALKHRAEFPVPGGTYGKITLDMDVIPGPWYPVNPKAWHNLFWMVRNDRNSVMFGYAALRQPPEGSPQVMLRQGIGVPHPKKTKLIQDIALTTGKTYHVSYRYDMARGAAELVISQGGSEVARLPAVPLLEPPAKSFRFDEGDKLTIDLSTVIGENDPASAEAPSIGWTYRNLNVMLYRSEQ